MTPLVNQLARGTFASIATVPAAGGGYPPKFASPLSAPSRRYYIRIVGQEHLHLATNMSANRAVASPLMSGLLPALAIEQPT